MEEEGTCCLKLFLNYILGTGRAYNSDSCFVSPYILYQGLEGPRTFKGIDLAAITAKNLER